MGYCVFCTYKNANLSILNQGTNAEEPVAGSLATERYAPVAPLPHPTEAGLEAAETPTEEQAKKAICRENMEYAQEYCDQFEAYSQAPNRAGHLALVLRACAAGTPEELEGLLTYRTGENGRRIHMVQALNRKETSMDEPLQKRK